MKQELINHFQIQFERQNSKYNRLWGQLSSLALFLIGTLFILISYFIEAVNNNNQMQGFVAVIMTVILAVFCASFGIIIGTEMDQVKENIDGILGIFEELAFPKAG